jgi:hypothetical protein
LRNIYLPNPPLLEALNRDIERIDLGLRGMRIVPRLAGPACPVRSLRAEPSSASVS